MTKKVFKEVLIALSLANLLFAGSWRIFLYPPTFDYHIEVGPSRIDYLGILLSVVLTAAMFLVFFWSFKFFYREKANLLANLSFFVLFLIALNIFRLQIPHSSATFSIAVAFQGLSLLLLAVLLTRWRNLAFNTARALVLMLSPFILITFSQAILGTVNVNPPEIETDPPTSIQLANVEPKSKENIKSRVVWVIFDEFDYRIPFELKPVELPEFERLKESSLTATNSNSPARDTLESIPSLLTGKTVIKSEPKGLNELVLNFFDKTSAKFSHTPNIFSNVKAIGGNTAVNGFYHSYCRVFGQLLSVCKWEGEKFKHEDSLIYSMLYNFNVLGEQMLTTFATEPSQLKQPFDRNFIENRLEIKEMIEDRPKRFGEIYQIATNPNIDLAFIHIPIPHPPSRFDRISNAHSSGVQDYVNNLVLTDLVLGDIRKNMEEAGQWDNSSVIISTDHQLRVNRWEDAENYLTESDKKLTQGVEDARIPFFLKLKHQKESIVYDKPFNTVVTHDLILAVMKGEIETAEDARIWLDAAAK